MGVKAAMRKAIKDKCLAERMLVQIDAIAKDLRRKRKLWNSRLGDALRTMTDLATRNRA